MYALGAALIGAILLGLLFVAFSSSSHSSQAAPGAGGGAASTGSYKGRPLVDDILRKRHGLSEAEDRQWSAGEVSRHNTASDLWLIVEGKVYDVTDFVDEHPGGIDAIMKRPGMDNTAGFFAEQHPDRVRQMVGEYYIGRVAS